MTDDTPTKPQEHEATPPAPRAIRTLRRAPLSTQAREAILDSIARGLFPNGQLPPEDELAVQLGVSRTTVRAALQTLQRDGLVTRRRGVGTVVNRRVTPSRLALQRLAGFKVVLTELGYQAEVTSESTFEPANKDWAERLGVARSHPVYVMRRLFTADGQPAILAVDIANLDALRERPPHDLHPDDFYTFFRQFGARPIEYAVVEIVPKAATPSVAERLGIRRGAPHLLLAETSYDVKDNVIAFSEVVVNDAYVRFDVVRRSE
jgi:GntR family transcriptional regulator